ncbi:MAG: hypothetical protein HY290_08220 [Planctomycetia bacterium]|nr:hypothetical protein [Planctomycetia bacterium]
MIRNEFEYKSTLARLAEAKSRVSEYRNQLERTGLSSEQIDSQVASLEANCSSLQDEVRIYEQRTAPTWRVSLHEHSV